jgi:hypothetical protein
MEEKPAMRKDVSTEKDISVKKGPSMGVSSFMEKLQRLGLQGIALVGFLIFLFLTLYSWLYTVKVITDTEVLTIERESLGMSLLGMMLFMLFAEGILFVARRLNERWIRGLAAAGAVFVTAFSFFLIGAADNFPMTDQQAVYYAAVNLYEGNLEPVRSYGYFNAYPYQLNLASVFAWIFRLTGNSSPQMLQYGNALCAGLTLYAGFHITRELFHRVETECIYLLSMILFLPIYLYTQFVYGEMISICAAVCSGWIFLVLNRRDGESRESAGKRRLQSGALWLLLGLTLLLGCLVRGSTLIIWIAMVILEGLLVLKNRKAGRLAAMAALGLLLWAGQAVFTARLEEQVGTNLHEGTPALLWIAMGLQEDVADTMGPGGYSGYNWYLFHDCDQDPERASAAAMEDIRARMEYWAGEPGEMLRFFKEKQLCQWNEPSYCVFAMTRDVRGHWWVRSLYTGLRQDLLYGFMDRYQAVLYFMMLAGFLAFLVKKEDAQRYLPGLILVGGFLFTAIWEAKSRYAYPYLVLAMPHAAYGFMVSRDRLVAFMRSAKRRIQKDHCIQ